MLGLSGLVVCLGQTSLSVPEGGTEKIVGLWFVMGNSTQGDSMPNGSNF